MRWSFPPTLFGAIATLPSEIGVLAVIRAPQPTLPLPADFCLLLEDLQDPGNVGTILLHAPPRPASDQVLMSKHCAFAWSPKVLRAGQGAHFLTTVVEDVDLVAWIASFRAVHGRVIALMARGGADLFQAKLMRPLALAIGNEGDRTAGTPHPRRGSTHHDSYAGRHRIVERGGRSGNRVVRMRAADSELGSDSLAVLNFPETRSIAVICRNT